MARSRVIDWLGVVLVCATAALAGLLELFLVPLYAGATLVPVAVLFAVASNVFLPRLGRALVPTTAAAVLPFAAWLVVVLVVGWYARPEGDVVLPGGGAVEWVGLGVSLGGALAGTVTVVLSAPRPQPVRRPPVELSQ
jgi:hypothetical protein